MRTSIKSVRVSVSIEKKERESEKPEVSNSTDISDISDCDMAMIETVMVIHA
jgi:hypothetical protein